MIWANTSSQGSRKWTSAFLVSQWNDGKLLPQCRLHTLILHSYSQILMKRTRYIFPLLFIPCASHFIDETHGQVLVNSNRFVLFGFYKKFNRFQTFSILCLSLLVQPVLFMIWTCAYLAAMLISETTEFSITLLSLYSNKLKKHRQVLKYENTIIIIKYVSSDEYKYVCKSCKQMELTYRYVYILRKQNSRKCLAHLQCCRRATKLKNSIWNSSKKVHLHQISFDDSCIANIFPSRKQSIQSITQKYML